MFIYIIPMITLITLNMPFTRHNLFDELWKNEVFVIFLNEIIIFLFKIRKYDDITLLLEYK